MKLFGKPKNDSRIEVIHGIERLYLKNYSDVLYVVAKKGDNIRQLCTQEEYEKGIVKIHDEQGKRVMITLQSVSR